MLTLPTLLALLASLGSPSYAARERAGRALVEMGTAAKAALKAAEQCRDVEVSERAKAVLAEIVGREVESLRPLPEIDAAWLGEDGVYGSPIPSLHAYLGQAYLLPPPDPAPLYWNFYLATELWVRDRLLDGDTPATLRPTLADMHRRDQVWLRAHQPQAMVVVDWQSYAAGK